MRTQYEEDRIREEDALREYVEERIREGDFNTPYVVGSDPWSMEYVYDDEI